VIFAAQMRIGSLEIVAALVAVALIGARPRAYNASESGSLAPIKAILRVIEFGRERSFSGLCPLTIGRDRSAELLLTDPEVSRRHARLEARGGVVYVRDLESSNGTFLNGKRLRGAIETREGDAIDIGTTRMIVEHLQPWT
jgi:pSer/pThr/pTyr-binding forkhead associated (FHA) protein